MKLQLCVAQLLVCGVLMRIEPFGHLDVVSIRWPQDWLESFTGQHARLRSLVFFEDVRCRSKVVLRMMCVNFQYPSKDRPTIVDVYLTVSQVSRVAVVCANGAGESTVIKGLIGEQLPILGYIGRCSSLLGIDDIKACTVLRASSLSWMLPVYNASLRRG